jgi:hypothetical protein
MVMANSAETRERVSGLSRRLQRRILRVILPARECHNRRSPSTARKPPMNLEVSPAAREEWKLNQTAGAAYVIAQEDVRRSGLGSIPAVPRMVPGFPAQFADEMLVLIDGRSIAGGSIPYRDYADFQAGPLSTAPGQSAHASQLDIGKKLDFDTGIYFVSAPTGRDVPGSVRTGARLGWRPAHTGEIGLEGRNPLHGRHREFAPTDHTPPSETGRAVRLKVTWAF